MLTSAGNAVSFCSYLGGSSLDYPNGLHITDDGTVLVTGVTHSANFPTTAGVLDQTLGGTADGFVAEFRLADGDLRWSTYFGGSQYDTFLDVTTDQDDGNIQLVGWTASADFPLQNAADTVYGGPSEAVVVGIATDGTALKYSTYLGGAASDWGLDIAAVGSSVYVCGHTGGGFPVTSGAHDTSQNGFDGFVARIKTDGSNLIATYLGGTETSPAGLIGEIATDIAIHASGDVVVAGDTNAPDFPVAPGAFDSTPNGGQDIYVCRMSPDLALVNHATYVGGAGDDYAGMGVVVDEDGRVYGAVQWTDSQDFPTTTHGFQ